MGRLAAIAALVETLAVVGRVEDRRAANVGGGEQPVEKAADAPRHRVAIAVAVEPPVVGAAVKPVAGRHVGDIGKAAALQHRLIFGVAHREFVADRKMAADLVDQDQLRLAVVEIVRQPVGHGVIAVDHRHIAKLLPTVDLRALGIVHPILVAPAGALGIEIDGAETGGAGIRPDRRRGADRLAIIVAGTAKAQGHVAADAAMVDRRGETEIVDRHRSPCPVGTKTGIDPGRVIDIEIGAGDTLVDDQHDIGDRLRPLRPERHGPARAMVGGRHVIGVEQSETGAAVRGWQAAVALAAAKEEQHRQPEQDRQRQDFRAPHHQSATRRRLQPDAEQQQQRLARREQKRHALLRDRAAEIPGALHHGDEILVAHEITDRPLIAVDQHRGRRQQQRQRPAQPALCERGDADQTERAQREQSAKGDQCAELDIGRRQHPHAPPDLAAAKQQAQPDQQIFYAIVHQASGIIVIFSSDPLGSAG